MQIWDILPAVDATAFARVVPDDLPDTLSALLPDRQINGVKSRTARRTRTNVTAKYRAYNAETPIGRRPEALTVTEQALPPIGQKLPVTEWETLWLEFAGGGGNAFAGMLQQMYDDIEQNVRAIRNRMTLARGDLLTDGKFTLAGENGLVLEADYGLNAALLPTASQYWNNADALILSDLQAWDRVVRTRSGRPPVAVRASSLIVGYMLKNDEVRASYWGGNANAQPNLNRAQLSQVLRDNGLPPIVEEDHQLEVDGVVTRVLPENRLIMVVDGVGETQWGVTAESLELVASNAVDFTRADAPGLFAAVYRTPDPVTGWTKVTGVGMPVLGEPDGLLSARVLA